MKRVSPLAPFGRLVILASLSLVLLGGTVGTMGTVAAAPHSGESSAVTSTTRFPLASAPSSAPSSALPPAAHTLGVTPGSPDYSATGRRIARFPSRQVWSERQRRQTPGTKPGTAATNSPQGSGDLSWSGGPIHETPTSYAIFWGPSWSNGSGGLTPDGQIAQNFLNDTGNTSFESIASQYYDATAHIAPTLTLTGVYLDPSTPPADSSCGGATIEDVDIQNEVDAAIAANAANGWTPDTTNATYFVYTPNGYFVNDGTGACSEQTFCAYHTVTSVSTLAYAVMAYPTDLSSCGVPTSPNGNAAGDALANATSYELFDTITDPQIGTGWMDAAGYEIGDKCAYDFSAGTTQLNNGHTYALQTEYSNATSSCVTKAQAHLQATPSAVSLTTPAGTSPPPQTLTLANTGVATLNWSLSSTLPSWLAVSPTSGTVAAGANAPITLTFSTTDPSPHVYTTTLTFADPNADNSPLSVPVTVSSAAHLQLSPSSVSLTTVPGMSPPAQTLTLQNTGTATLNWSLTATLPSWLAVSPTSGSLASTASQPITLTFSTPSTTPQTYTTTLTFADPNADNSPVSVPVTVTSGYPHFQTTPASFMLTTAVGTTPAPQTLTLANTGVATLNWSLTSTLPSWLALSATSGSVGGGNSQNLTLIFSVSGTSPQTYSTTLTFADPNADNSPFSVLVSVTTTSQLPLPWSDQDIGAVGAAGSALYQKGTFTVNSSGADIWNTADGFNYVYRTLTGDGDIVARVVSLSNTDPSAKAGVMIRGSLDPTAPAVSMIVSYSNGLWAIMRTLSGAAAFEVAGASACCWVKLDRHGSTFTTFVSSNGQQWAQVNTITVPMASNVYIGLAVSSHNTSKLNSATFDNVEVSSPPYFTAAPAAVYATTAPGASPAAQTLSLSNTGARTLNWSLTSTLPSWLTVSPTSGKVAANASQPLTLTFTTPSTTPQTYSTTLVFSDPHADNAPFSVPVTVDATATPIPTPPWADLDIGAPGMTGSAGYTNGTFTVAGGGSDIYNSSDQFNFMYQPLTGDGQIVARVTGIQNTDPSAFVGVMMRETLTPSSTFALTLVSNSIAVMRFRASTASNAAYVAGPNETPPYWVKLVRSGNTFSSSVSSDGVTWTPVSTQTIPMSSTIYVGLAVTAHNNSALNTSTFDNVQVTVPPYAHMQVTPASVYLSTGLNTNPSPQTLTLQNTGQTTLHWTVSSTVPSWLVVSATSGSIPGGTTSSITLTFSTASSTSQTYSTNLIFNDPSANNTPISVPVQVIVVAPGMDAYSTEILGDQPLRYYRLGESRGATDLGSLNQRAAYVGNVALGATGLLSGDSDTAASFTGGEVSVPDAGLPTGSQPWTLEAWCTPTSTANAQTVIALGSGGGPGYSAAVMTQSGGWWIWGWGSGEDSPAWGTVVPGATTYLVATYDGTTERLYINGTLAGSFTVRKNVQPYATIGQSGNGSGNPFSGTIDEAAYYNAALSATQIQNHYNVGTQAISGNYASTVLGDHPLHYYRLDDTSVGATSALDLSSNAQAGTYGGGVATSGGLLIGSADTAMAFDGTGGIVTVPDAGMPTGNQPWTLEAWCKPNSTADSQTVLSLGSGGGGGYSAAVMTHSGGWWIWGWGSGEDSPAWGTVVPGATTYLVATYDGTTERLYINGTLAGSFVVNKNVQPYATIGQSGNGWGLPFNGTIDEAAFYNYPLSATQIQSHYNVGTGAVQGSLPQRAAATPTPTHRVPSQGVATPWLGTAEAGLVERTSPQRNSFIHGPIRPQVAAQPDRSRQGFVDSQSHPLTYMYSLAAQQNGAYPATVMRAAARCLS